MTQKLHQRTYEDWDDQIAATLRTELWFIERDGWQLSGWELRSKATIGQRAYHFSQRTPIEPTPKRWTNHRREAVANILRQARLDCAEVQTARQEEEEP